MGKRIFITICALMAMVLAFAPCALGAEEFKAMEYAAEAASVKSVSVDVRDRRIEVVTSGDGMVRVSGMESAKEYYDIALSEDGALTVALRNERDWRDYFGWGSDISMRTLRLELPAVVAEQLNANEQSAGIVGMLDIATTGEDVALSGVSLAKGARVSVNGGSIVLDGINVGEELTLAVKNGNLTGTIVGSWDEFDITCEYKKGDCNLPERKEGGAKRLNVVANNGDVQLEFVKDVQE